jgi:hypothetical protein
VLTFNTCRLCPHCIYVFCTFLRTNSELCHVLRKPIGFYNRDKTCLQRGTDWVFKYSSLCFVFKGLNKTSQIGRITKINNIMHTLTAYIGVVPRSGSVYWVILLQGTGGDHRTWYSFLFVTFKFLIDYYYLPVYPVRLVVLWIKRYNFLAIDLINSAPQWTTFPLVC